MNWLACTGGGRRHWGRDGAAGVLVSARDGERSYVLLDERADWVHQGGTFGVPGGAIQPNEKPFEAALREVGEEVRGIDVQQLVVVHKHVQPCADCTRWTYTTFLATLPARVDVSPCSAESDGVHWVALDDVAGLPLHPGFATAWPTLRDVLAV